MILKCSIRNASLAVKAFAAACAIIAFSSCDDLRIEKKPQPKKSHAAASAAMTAAGHLEKLAERKKIPVSPRPLGLALSPDDRKLYVACALQGNIDVIDTELLAVEEKLGPFDDPIYQIVLSSDGRLLFAHGINARQLFVIETHTGRTLAKIPMSKNITHMLAIPGTDRVLIATAEIPNASIISGFRGETVGTIKIPEPVGYMAVAPGGQVAAAASGLFAITDQGMEGRGGKVYIFDPRSSGTAKVLAKLDPGVFVRKPLFVRGDKVLLVPDQGLNSVDVYEIETRRHIKRLEVGFTPERLVMVPGGRQALVFGHSEEVAIINCITAAGSGRARLPGFPSDVAVSPDGNFLYAALSAQNPGVKNRIAVVELEGQELRDLIPTGEDPVSMALSRDGRTLYVAAFQENTVSVIK